MFRRHSYYFLFILLFTTQSFSQSFHFGRNKVQYTDFQWQVLKTKHFDIYYITEMKDLAEKGAAFAEEGFKELEQRFNFSITRRIPLIFYSSHMHFQQTNITPGFIPEGVGGFFEFMKGRVVVPGNGDIKRFRRVIRHELVHVFMTARMSNHFRRYERREDSHPPLWFTEGLAEFWSGGWGSQGEMVLKDAVLHNYVVGLENIYTVFGTYFMYKLGQDILIYIADQYGPEKILLLMENYWKYHDFEESFIETLGIGYKEFDLKYLSQLKKRFYPKLSEQEFNMVVNPTILREGYNFKPVYYWDKKQEYILTVGNQDGYSSIYQTPLKSLTLDQKQNSRRIVKGESSSDFEAFHIFDSKIDINQNHILAFSAKSGETDRLYLKDIKADTLVDALRFEGISGILSPNWSSDDSKITFSGLGINGYLDIYEYEFSTQTLIRLTDDFYADRDPVYAPDGKYIVFSSDRMAGDDPKSTNLALLERNSGKIYPLTRGMQSDKSPHFSDDGRYLVFTSDRDGTPNICLMENALELAKSGMEPEAWQLTNFVGSTFDPCWVDSSRIVYTTYEHGRFQIRLLSNFLQNQQPKNRIYLTKKNPPKLDWQYQNINDAQVQASEPYRTKFNLDFAQSQVSNDPIWGNSGGAQFAFSDMLGDEQYFLTVFNNARVSSDFWNSFNVAVQRVSLKERLNYAIGLYRFTGFFYNPEDFYYFEESVGSSLILSYPLSHFSRIAFHENLYYSDKDRFFEKPRYAFINSNFLSYIYDNSIWGPSGPMDGQRINVTIGNTYDFAWSNVNYLTGLVDLRKYFRISQRTAYAVRAMTLFNEGTEARQFYFGGSWDLRLYRRWRMHGKRIFLISQEFRFPLIDLLAVRMPVFSLGFQSIRGALFFDAGNAWNDHFPGLKGSMGLGVRLNLGRFLVLRWDVGRKTDFKSISNTNLTQFFFGWDF